MLIPVWDEDSYYIHDLSPASVESLTIFEQDFPETVDTGLLDIAGRPILRRLPSTKGKLGF